MFKLIIKYRVNDHAKNLLATKMIGGKNMGRSVYPYQVAQNYQQAAYSAADTYLKQMGFKYINYKNNQQCYKKGTGMMTAMQFIRLSFDQNTMYIEAWIRSGIGSLYIGKEMELNSSFVAVIPKNSLKDTVTGLFNFINAQLAHYYNANIQTAGFEQNINSNMQQNSGVQNAPANSSGSVSGTVSNEANNSNSSEQS